MAAAARNREQWRELVEDLEQSGEPIGTFAARFGVNPRTLGWWRWKLGVWAQEPTGQPAFLPVMVSSAEEPAPCAGRTGPIAFDLPSGVVVRVPDGMDIAQAVALATALGRAA